MTMNCATAEEGTQQVDKTGYFGRWREKVLRHGLEGRFTLHPSPKKNTIVKIASVSRHGLCANCASGAEAKYVSIKSK